MHDVSQLRIWHEQTINLDKAVGCDGVIDPAFIWWIIPVVLASPLSLYHL